MSIKNQIIYQLLNMDYRQLDTNSEDIALFYQANDTRAYIVALFSLYSGEEINRERYEQLIQQISNMFDNISSKENSLLSIILSANPYEARNLCLDSDCHWVIDLNEKRLLIYENQLSDFNGIKGALEKVLYEPEPDEDYFGWNNKVYMESEVTSNLEGSNGHNTPNNKNWPNAYNNPNSTNWANSNSNPNSSNWPSGNNNPNNTKWPEGYDNPENTNWSNGYNNLNNANWPNGYDNLNNVNRPNGQCIPNDANMTGGYNNPNNTYWPNAQNNSSNFNRSDRHNIPNWAVIQGHTNRVGWVTFLNTTIIVINIILFILIQNTHIFGETENALNGGALSWYSVVKEREYYRVITSMFLHSSFSHLANNMLVLFFVGDNLERAAGKIRYILIYFGSGIIAGISSIVYNMRNDELNIYTLSVGASGAIFGIVGAMVYILIINKGHLEDISIVQIVLFAVFSLYGGFTSVNVDNAGHIGGFVAGLILAIILYRKQKAVKDQIINND